MKVPWRDFMSTPEEFHAFVIGLCEVLASWPPRIRIPSPSTGEGQGKGKGDSPHSVVMTEYHYYSFGRALGVIAWLIIAKIIQEAFW